jgi:imidazolonepropionase-like amidohydrolase
MNSRIPGFLPKLFVISAFAGLLCLGASPLSGSSGQLLETLIIKHCSVFDSVSGKMLPDRTVVVFGGRILSVLGPNEHSAIDAIEGAYITNAGARSTKRIDGRGKFLIPGLIDAHVHLVHVLDYAHVTGDEVLPLYLAAGVTSVRSTGDEIVAATLVARFAEAHPETSPRVFTCSPLLDGNPPIHPDVGRAVTDPKAVPALFDDLVKWKIRTVKIYAGTRREVGKAIIEESHRRGIPVTAHLGPYTAQEAVEDGIDCLEHIWSVFNYVIPPSVSGQPGHRGNLDLGNPLCENLVAQLVRKKTRVDPTLVVFRNMILLPDEPFIRDSPDNALAPKRLREYWPEHLKRSGCPQGGPLEDRRREFAKFQELTGKLYRAGVPILAGTDSPEPHVTPGVSLHTELELLVGSGLSPAAALQSATIRNAAALKEESRLGSIKPGMLADMVLLRADPLKNIRNTRSIELVIRGGRVSSPNRIMKSPALARTLSEF